MNQRRIELEQIIESLKVKEHSFREWQDSEVTKRFMAELELDYWNTVEDHARAYSLTPELIAMAYREKAERSSLLESLITWKPKELLKDE
jgi:uncharacterized membrane protein